MPFLLAGLSSLIFGVADFAGGMAAKRAPATSIVVVSHLIGGLGVVAAAPWFGGSPAGTDLAWGAGAGLAGSLGLALLYHSLATTRMSVAAPVAAVFGTATPVLFGVIIGERPAGGAWAGVALAFFAILLLSSAGDAGPRAVRGAVLGSATGILFGMFGILISRTGPGSGVWPLVAARASSVTLMSLIAVGMGVGRLPRRGRSLAATAGLLDMAANILFLLAVREELLSLVAVIMSMYPASTLALARTMLGERIGAVRAVGLASGAAAVVLIVLA